MHYNSSRFKELIFIGFLLVVFANAYAQYEDLKFQRVTLSEGLPNNWVNNVTRDQTGYIWLATRDGLSRYDGLNVTNYFYDKEDSTSIPENNISDVFVDRDNNVWVGTEHYGLCIYNRRQDNFIRISEDNQQAPKEVRCITQHSNGEIWIGTHQNGVYVYDVINHRFKKISSSRERRANKNGIHGIVEDANGNMWVAGNSSYLDICHPQKGIIDEIKLPFPNGSKIKNNNKKLMFDTDSTLWIGTNGNGVVYYNRKKQSFERLHGLSNQTIKDFEQIGNEIFIATDNGGLNILDKTTFKIRVVKHNPYDRFSLSSNGLYNLFLDEDGILWVATFDGGINYYNPVNHRFTYYYPIPNQSGSLTHQNITCIHEAESGDIYIGTDGGGINVFDPKTKKFKSPYLGAGLNAINDPYVISVLTDEEFLYVGAFQKGVSKLNLNTNEITSFNSNLIDGNYISNNNITHIQKDKFGHIWYCASGDYLNKFNPSTGDIKVYNLRDRVNNKVGSHHVDIMYLDTKGRLWLGSRDGTLRMYDYANDDFKEYLIGYETNSDRRYTITSILMDDNDVFWAGTAGGGLKRFDLANNEISSFTMYNGLPSDNVLGILSDEENNLWLSTTKGICCFNLVSHEVNSFNVNDGLQGKQFSIRSAIKASDGTMYFGGVKGLNAFKPANILKDSTCLSLVFTDFKILNKSVEIGKDSPLKQHISTTKNITLSHEDYIFSLEFQLINYTSPDKVTYSYMMEGFDKGWTKTDNKGRLVTYTNLPGGNYTFKVKAENHDGIECPQQLALKIKVIPPFYRTDWFILMVAFVVLLFMVSFFRVRNKMYEAQKKKLERKVKARTLKISHQKKELELHRNHLEELVSKRTKDLVKAKEKAEESDRLKSSFLANMSHEIRTPMNAIVGFSNLLNVPDITSEEKQNFLNIIADSSDILLRLIDDIIDISKIEAGQITILNEDVDLSAMLHTIGVEYEKKIAREHRGLVRFNLKLPERNVVVRTDKTRVRQVLVNFLENAIKFTHKGEIKIVLNVLPDLIKVSVCDTGIGIPEDSLKFVFQRFTKIERDTQTLYGGTGLGLFICKRIVEMNKGEIGVTSTLGKGSCFWFTLPYS
ncbi:hypothetical protein E9993_16070 [Labilibacter sediminis]|nr:hypothetical protein E9993_16070 [Labilibacter sediminis]